MMLNRKAWYLILGLICAAFVFGPLGCSQEKPRTVQTVKIPDGEIDPEVWGKAYPEEYETWKATAIPDPPGKSKYKKGFDKGHEIYDKLSEYPYMALAFNGWGFGVEYNEPRGHWYMVIDQLEIDPSRLKAGGVCLTCKTPYAPKLQKDLGVDYFKLPYKEVWSKIPEKHQKLGATCVDCHDNKDMSLNISRGFSLGEALKSMGVDQKKLSRQEMRSLVCAQCHVSYSIPKDAEGKSVGIYFPWQNSKYGNISIEDIVKTLRTDQTNKEWKQSVTGFKMAFIRHPEYELFSNNSVHAMAKAACADCHMPYTKVGVYKISDHRLTSPLKNDMRPCMQCHTESADWLKQQVINIQDRTVSLQIRAGYAVAVAAKLFEASHKAKEQGKTLDQALYDKAKDFYEEAFYRSLFIGAENSVGFHNPAEAMRIQGDAIAFAMRSESYLRQMLAKAGVETPIMVDLELDKYLNNRGEKKLMRDKSVEFKDPFGLQEKF